jgi:DNA mismatch repair ATPase MutS
MEDPTMESVTFLYTLTEGICDKSYGFYTAKMAGLDDKVKPKQFYSN